MPASLEANITYASMNLNLLKPQQEKQATPGLLVGHLNRVDDWL